MGTTTTIVIIVAVLIIAYLARLANRKAMVIDLILEFINVDLLQQDAAAFTKDDYFPKMTPQQFKHLYDHIMCHIVTFKTGVEITQDIVEIHNCLCTHNYTINQASSLILNRNGYKLRTIHS